MDSAVKEVALVPVGQDWSMPSIEGVDARYLDSFFATQLANVTALHVYGKPLAELKPVLRADIRAYAESYTEDAVTRYAGILDAVERMHR